MMGRRLVVKMHLFAGKQPRYNCITADSQLPVESIRTSCILHHQHLAMPASELPARQEINYLHG
jgi:hypothetical protein